MNWHDANKACNALGKGWRLPTKDELNTLYQNKDFKLNIGLMDAKLTPKRRCSLKRVVVNRQNNFFIV